MGISAVLHTNRQKEKEVTFDIKKMWEMQDCFLPAEWHQQRLVQLTWPHEKTDWAPILEEVEECFTQIAAAITKHEKLLIVAPDIDRVRQQIEKRVNLKNALFFQCETNDTWARDHAFITLLSDGKPRLLDFCFNGWGEKFPAELDNAINRKLYDAGVVTGSYESHLDFVLEGGSIESDGAGTLLTTTHCLTAPHRNCMSQPEIESYLTDAFNLRQILWLDYGALVGDDTDGHIDTLARLCPGNTIVYVQCNDTTDEQYHGLQLMEEQLKTFETLDGKSYRLLPLPSPTPIYDSDDRLPATYANFLILNDALLFPTYGQPENDQKAREVLSQAFPGYEITGIDCRTLIKQHGSLHCVTMQYPV